MHSTPLEVALVVEAGLGAQLTHDPLVRSTKYILFRWSLFF